MSSALTVRDNQTIAPVPTGVGFANLVLPVMHIELVQAQSARDGVPTGSFLNKVTNEWEKEIVAVPLNYREGRTLFPPKFSRDSKPICRSRDGILPIMGDEFLDPQAPSCAVCPKSKWGKNNSKPECGQNGNLLMWDYTNDLALAINVRGTSLKPVQALKVAIVVAMKKAAIRGESVNIFDFSFKMTAKQEVRPAGVFYMLQFSDIKLLSERGLYADAYNQYVRDYQYAEDEPAEPAVSKAVDTELSNVIDPEVA